MEWLWIILRYLFPRDHIRQGAEALRHRVAQLIHIAKDEAQLAQLLIDPALRRHLEFMILDAEECLRLWIAMRGCQIAKARPGAPHSRAAPHLIHAKDLPNLLARIDALAAACDAMEQRAQAHAARLKQLREADPLGLASRTACGPLRHDASHRATSPAFGEGGPASSSTGNAGGGGMRSMTEGAARSAATATRGPPHSIEGANP
jgi:hypothetical protein